MRDWNPGWVWAGILVAAALGCATPQGVNRLDTLYPVGEPPPAFPKGTRLIREGAIFQLPKKVPAEAVDETRGDGFALAKTFRAYERTEKTRRGYTARQVPVCDYVLVDEPGVVVGAYRVRGGCKGGQRLP